MSAWPKIARRIRVPLGFVFAAIYLWLARPAWWALAAGGAVAAAGLLLRALASGHVRKNTELTTTGPYAYTRNPLYLGSMIIGAGFAVAARSVWVVAGMVALFLAVYVPVIRSEEQFLRAQFPEYDEYARRVPRFGIALRPARTGGNQFSSALYVQHREYNAAIGAVLMLAALAVKLFWSR
ncbi:MAG: isoprenylcysteine carboxylmethyltransferase family protein [Terriglobales bacterium]